jgi:hypothetical protein
MARQTPNSWSRWSLADVTGDDAVARRLKELERKLRREEHIALYQEALIITGVSMRRTPVDVTTGKGGGTLRDSHETSAPRRKGTTVQVDIKVGGPAAEYAAVVHERVIAPSGQPVRHIVGQAKFLESAILEAEKTLGARIAKRLQLNRIG